jgi:transcriptional regulator with XRE-family HTH domain
MSTLKDWREKKAVSIRDLSAISGVSTATISHIENGLYKPRHITKRKIAEALDLKPEDIDFSPEHPWDEAAEG